MLDTRDDADTELTSEDILDAAVASRRASGNLSYFVFTATPKTKTLELFGRLPNPDEPPSKTNKPEALQYAPTPLGYEVEGPFHMLSLTPAYLLGNRVRLEFKIIVC